MATRGVATHESKMKEFFVGYRFSFRPNKSTRYYWGIGVGFADAVPITLNPRVDRVPPGAYDVKRSLTMSERGLKPSATMTLGIKRFLGAEGNISIGLDYRSTAIGEKHHGDYLLEYKIRDGSTLSRRWRGSSYEKAVAVSEYLLVIGFKLP